jgi:hypothetical protein
MITCLGLVVGVVTSTDRREVLEQCARFLHNHHILNTRVEFEIDKEVYATIYDTEYFDDGYFGVLFKMYDGFIDGIQIPV